MIVIYKYYTVAKIFPKTPSDRLHSWITKIKKTCKEIWEYVTVFRLTTQHRTFQCHSFVPVRHVNLRLCAVQRTVSSRNKHKTLLMGWQNNHSCQKRNLTMGVFFFSHQLLNLAARVIHSTLVCASCKLIVSTRSTNQQENNEPLKLCGRWAREKQEYVASQCYCAYEQADNRCWWIRKLQQRNRSMGSTVAMWLMPKNKTF